MMMMMMMMMMNLDMILHKVMKQSWYKMQDNREVSWIVSIQNSIRIFLVFAHWQPKFRRSDSLHFYSCTFYYHFSYITCPSREILISVVAKIEIDASKLLPKPELGCRSRVSFSATQKSSVIFPEQDGKEEEVEGEDKEGDFSLADKYSNQMSLPLWDPGAQIQAIPGSSLIQKRLFVGCVGVCLNKKNWREQNE